MTRLLIAAGLVLAAAAAPLAAQEYPLKPIRLVVPNSAGGATDVAARLTQNRMMEILGQPLVLDYRVAAGGVVGTNQVAQSAPDGYTLIMVFDSFTANPYLFKDVQYDPVKDFQPVSMLVHGIQVLAAYPGAGMHNFAEFMKLAKSKGAAFDLGTAGPGTSSRFSIELFKRATGVPPSQYQIKLRLDAARRLLRETKKSVITIANEVGYSNPSHFAQLFRKETGLAPTDYRRER